MMTYKCYLAGPIQHDLTPNRWRQQIQASNNKKNIEFINPLDIEDSDAPPEDIVTQDLEAIDNSDALLVRWKEIPSAGTPMEVFYAYRKDIPVVVWWEGELDDLSPWMKYHSDAIIEKGSRATTVLQTVL